MQLPTGTILIAVATLVVAVVQSLCDWARVSTAIGIHPSQLSTPRLLLSAEPGQVLPGWVALFTYTLPHGGWWHVLPNTSALVLFGATTEKLIGTGRFVILFLAAGAIGALCHSFVPPYSATAEAGSSLAIAGICGSLLAFRWSSKKRSRLGRCTVMAAEIAVASLIVMWLRLRSIPAVPDRVCSLMYHFIPFFVLWLLTRGWFAQTEWRHAPVNLEEKSI